MSSPADGRRRHAVFDLDGTLIDSLPDLAAALNALLRQEDYEALSHDEVKRMVGDGAARLVERAFAARGVALGGQAPAFVERFLALYEGNAAVNTQPWPGARRALETLVAQGWHLAVCTNKPYRPTMEILTALDLSHLFTTVVGGDSLAFKKPDPRHLQGTLAAMAATPETAVMVGDSQNDALAARAAGVPVVLVTFGYTRMPVSELGADLLIDSFAELVPALSRLRGTNAP